MRIQRICLLSCVCVPLAAFSLFALGLRGDFNGDGRLGVLDALTLLVRGAANPADNSLDFNGDGRYSLADAVALVRQARDNSTQSGPDTGEHQALPEGALAVDSAGVCAVEGGLYMLTRDISSPVSTLFLAKDVTLDLNGYTLTYADAGYGHVPNGGFEDGLTGWDMSKAPGVELKDTRTTHTFIGDKILYLPYQQEVVSGWVDLPVANRTYYAMCGVAEQEMVISLYVEDSLGNQVYSQFTFGSTVRQTCPELNRSPKLGGGFVFAQFNGKPAGRYRVRVRAESGGVLIDEVDIRPAMDVGVGIVDGTSPWSYYKCILDGDYAAFTDYNQPGQAGAPLAWVPRVSGSGTITIRNGVIRSGAVGVRSWGVQSTAGDVNVVLENVRFEASGINTFAVDVPQAAVRNCRFEMDSPFIIDRHRQVDQPVSLRGPGSSEVADCQFIGGQGNLTVSGANSSVHDNLFVNRQMVTNHYSLGIGDGGKVYNNRFEPEVGSGILIGKANGVEIYDNVFRVAASPPTCEYGFEDYSVNAIRVTDYNSPAGQGASEIRIHDNRFFITGRDYPERAAYIPMAYAVFLSVGGGTVYVYDNDVTVEHQDPGSKALAAAFYVGGSDNGGRWWGNTVTSNVPAVWFATFYGSAKDAVFTDNTFRAGANAVSGLVPVRIGYAGNTAERLEFRSNRCEGMDFAVQATEGGNSWKVYWTLDISVADAQGNPAAGQEVVITDRSGTEAARQSTGADGRLSLELPQYFVQAGARTDFSPYKVSAGAVSDTLSLGANRSLNLALP
ncbi:hypothetical protein LLH00_19635 [bacterium]|nr:hypothetical protein [bacterium]